MQSAVLMFGWFAKRLGSLGAGVLLSLGSPAIASDTVVGAAAQLDASQLDALGAAAAGLAVAQAADANDSGYRDLQVQLEMVLYSANGRSTKRNLRIKQLEIPADGDKLLVVFDSPKVIKGTALLSFAHKQAPDDQWLYLPAIKRVKKITSRNRSGPFLSSEFSFEDLTPQELDKFAHQLLRREACGDQACVVVERIPLDEYSGYSRQEVWFDSAHWRIQKIDYFDRRGGLLKTLSVSDYQLYQDQHWRAQRMRMFNHQSGKSTELLWRDFQFDIGLDASRNFTANSLRRVR